MPDHDPDQSLRVDPLRSSGLLLGEKRRAAIAQRDQLSATIERLDRLLSRIVQRRRDLLDERTALDRRISPNLTHRRGRQPTPDGRTALPPVHADAKPLWGRRLRAACRAVLLKAGELSLVDLHAMLHHQGYVLANTNHVKALADAMGYEADAGRVRRVARGVYAMPDRGGQLAGVAA